MTGSLLGVSQAQPRCHPGLGSRLEVRLGGISFPTRLGVCQQHSVPCNHRTESFRVFANCWPEGALGSWRPLTIPTCAIPPHGCLLPHSQQGRDSSEMGSIILCIIKMQSRTHNLVRPITFAFFCQFEASHKPFPHSREGIIHGLEPQELGDQGGHSKRVCPPHQATGIRGVGRSTVLPLPLSAQTPLTPGTHVS